MTKVKARQRAKASRLKKAAKKKAAAGQPDALQPGRFESGEGEIKGAYQTAGKGFVGAKAKSSL